jgi:hypothetical protein
MAARAMAPPALERRTLFNQQQVAAMFRSRVLATLVATAAFGSVPAAWAQSSLGLISAEVGLGLDGGDGEGVLAGSAAGNFRITPSHGLQLGLGLADDPEGALGQIDLNLFLHPAPSAKYGFVFSLADADGREATIAYAGVTGIFQLGSSTFVSGQAVLGYARPGSIDFIALTGGLEQALSDTTSIFATLELAEFDEASLRTTAYTGRIGVSHQPDTSPWVLTAAVAVDNLSDWDASDETLIELGVTWRFGSTGGARRPVEERLFRSWQPFAPLLRRGEF